MKVNLIAQLEFKLAYNNVAVQHVSHFITSPDSYIISSIPISKLFALRMVTQSNNCTQIIIGYLKPGLKINGVLSVPV